MHSVAIIQRQHVTRGENWTHNESMPDLAWGDELVECSFWMYGRGQGETKESAISALRRDLVKNGNAHFMYLLDSSPTRFDHID